MPDWPRMLRKELAAAYCDMPLAEFERGVALGLLPQAVRVVDRDRWSRTQLDETMERMTGEGIPDYRASSNLYATPAA